MKYDVCIVGGGTAGSFAAISAAKKGLKVILVERYSSLGGTSSNGLVNPSMPSFFERTELYSEFEDRLRNHGELTYPPQYDQSVIDAHGERPDGSATIMYFSKEGIEYTLEVMCLENGVTLLYDATMYGVNINDNTIQSIKVNCLSTNLEIEAGNFIDATGDAILSEFSGVEMMVGNEYDGDNQFTSLRFEMGNVNISVFLDYMNNELKQASCLTDYPFYTFAVLNQGREEVLKPLMEKALKDGVLTKDEMRYLQSFSVPNKHGVFSFNCPRIPNKTNISDPFVRTSNYVVGRKMISRYIKFMREYVPGFENAYLNNVATTLGVRESKRIVGKYVLTKEDYINQQKFDDGIADCDWWIDIHKNDHDVAEEKVYQYKEFFEIPYRAMISDVKNLVIAGRCISSDFSAQASIRIQPQCRVMGEAAGIACSISKEMNQDLNAIDGSILKEIMIKNRIEKM